MWAKWLSCPVGSCHNLQHYSLGQMFKVVPFDCRLTSSQITDILNLVGSAGFTVSALVSNVGKDPFHDRRVIAEKVSVVRSIIAVFLHSCEWKQMTRL